MTVDTVTIANNVSVTAATTQNNIQNNSECHFDEVRKLRRELAIAK